MNLDEYQKGAARTLASKHDWVTSLTVLGLGLAGESGEVIEHLKKHVGHGHALDREKVGKELGDVLWYVAGLATSLGLSLDAIAARNLEKLRERYPEGFTSEAVEGPDRMSAQGVLEFEDPAPPRDRRSGSRGTSNANARGNTRDREARRTWLLERFASDVPGHCRCYRCGALLSKSTITVDRIKPGCQGGRYTRDNIRPACALCNSVTGATTRRTNGEMQ